MMILGLDTSAVTASVGLVRNGEVLCDFSLTGGLTHSEHLVPMIENCLEYSQVSLSQIDAFAVSVGPGSFTGLRIGVSTVKGLAFAQQKPCIAVSTLEALALAMIGSEGVVCPVMDARRGEFYNALFTVNHTSLERLTPDRAIAADQLAEELSRYPRVWVNGDGTDKFLGTVSLPVLNRAPAPLVRQNGVRVALLGEQAYDRGDFCTPNDLSPLYLRKPQAERERIEKTNVNNKGE